MLRDPNGKEEMVSFTLYSFSSIGQVMVVAAWNTDTLNGLVRNYQIIIQGCFFAIVMCERDARCSGHWLYQPLVLRRLDLWRLYKCSKMVGKGTGMGDWEVNSVLPLAMVESVSWISKSNLGLWDKAWDSISSAFIWHRGCHPGRVCSCWLGHLWERRNIELSKVLIEEGCICFTHFWGSLVGMGFLQCTSQSFALGWGLNTQHLTMVDNEQFPTKSIVMTLESSFAMADQYRDWWLVAGSHRKAMRV